MKKFCKLCNTLYKYCSSCSWTKDTFAKAYGYCCNRCFLGDTENIKEAILQEYKETFNNGTNARDKEGFKK